MIKKTTQQIVDAFKVIDTAKLGKVDDFKEKMAISKATYKLKKVYTEYSEFEQDGIKRLRPEGMDSIEQKLSANIVLTPAESLMLRRFNDNVQEYLKEEKDRERELDITPLSEKTFEKLVESNDFNVSQLTAIYEVLGEQ